MHTYTIHIIYPIFTYSILCTAPPNILLLYTPSINSHTHIHYSYTHSLINSPLHSPPRCERDVSLPGDVDEEALVPRRGQAGQRRRW